MIIKMILLIHSQSKIPTYPHCKTYLPSIIASNKFLTFSQHLYLEESEHKIHPYQYYTIPDAYKQMIDSNSTFYFIKI